MTTDILSVLIGTIAIVVTIALYVFGARRERNKEHDESLKKFRSAFNEVIAELSSGDKDVHYIMAREKLKCDAAIVEFRAQLSDEHRRSFDVVCDNFRQIRNANAPAILQFMESEAKGQPQEDGDASRKKLLDAINDVIDFAKPH